MRTFLVLIALSLSATQPVRAEGTYVPMTMAPDGIIAVPVRLNGQGPFPFVLDTGASRTAVSADLVQALALPIVAKTEVVSVTGREYRPVAEVAVSIGASQPLNLLASVVPASQLKAAAGNARGIIGQDLLMTLNYTLDYRRRRFIPSLPLDRDRSSIELPLEVQDGRVVLALPAKAGQPDIRLVPDSGSTMFVVFGRGGKQPFSLELMPGATTVGSISSTRVVPVVRLREVHLKRLTLRNQLAALVQRGNDDSLEIDGLLPLSIFSSAAFDMEGRKLLILPHR